MNELYFIIGFMTAVLVIGLFTFFWWRKTYGVWARQRRQREADQIGDATVVDFGDKPGAAKP